MLDNIFGIVRHIQFWALPRVSANSNHPAQFGDPHIRRFNLVALELRSHGETGGDVPEGYGQEGAAEEVASFMVRENSTAL